MTPEAFSRIAPTIPNQPGCYKYYDENNNLLYVGKAKNLRKRVSSYFQKTLDNYKTRKLVSLIHHIEFTVTDTEHDAFLLENSLIKHYRPKYNIELKDDKTYPYIVIKKEHFPRVYMTRRIIRDGSEYLGPFTQVGQVRELLQWVKESLPLRTCNLNLSPGNIAKGKFKVCLEYHLGNCKGPCEGLQSEASYQETLEQVRHIMKGNIASVIRFLKNDMMEHAKALEFEKAEQIRQKIDALQQYQSRSAIVNPHLGNIDIATLWQEENRVYVNFMRVNNGSIIDTRTIEVKSKLNETQEEILSFAVNQLRESTQSIAKELIVPFRIMLTDDTIKQVIPKAGDKKKLLDLSLKNARVFAEEMKRKAALMLQEPGPEQKMKVLESLQKSLHLKELPVHIECFDNSNFQGSYPVAAMVCFKNGKPDPQSYRHFHIKTVEGINDFASMAEVVYRRYKRLQTENASLPQLVIIDGGKGQLNAALESIQKLGLSGTMTVIGLAKREESIFFPGDKEPLQLPYDHPAHLLVRQIRDEVHRFGITFHRRIRSKQTFTNELEAIPGIGPQTATSLLKEFRSINNIKKLTERELTRVVGASKARIIYDYFQTKEPE